MFEARSLVLRIGLTASLFLGLLLTGLLLTGSNAAFAQKRFELVTGQAFDSALPKDFYLEGNAIPTEKRNAALVKTPSGARALFALIDITGYSSQVRKKYIGMIIAEGSLSVCGQAVSVGSYGFGLEPPRSGSSDQESRFFLYNQAGERLGECAVKKDADMLRPKPLQVVPDAGGTARLYLGRQWAELK